MVAAETSRRFGGPTEVAEFDGCAVLDNLAEIELVIGMEFRIKVAGEQVRTEFESKRA